MLCFMWYTYGNHSNQSHNYIFEDLERIFQTLHFDFRNFIYSFRYLYFKLLFVNDKVYELVYVVCRGGGDQDAHLLVIYW